MKFVISSLFNFICACITQTTASGASSNRAITAAAAAFPSQNEVNNENSVKDGDGIGEGEEEVEGKEEGVDLAAELSELCAQCDESERKDREVAAEEIIKLKLDIEKAEYQDKLERRQLGFLSSYLDYLKTENASSGDRGNGGNSSSSAGGEGVFNGVHFKRSHFKSPERG